MRQLMKNRVAIAQAAAESATAKNAREQISIAKIASNKTKATEAQQTRNNAMSSRSELPVDSNLQNIEAHKHIKKCIKTANNMQSLDAWRLKYHSNIHPDPTKASEGLWLAPLPPAKQNDYLEEFDSSSDSTGEDLDGPLDNPVRLDGPLNNLVRLDGPLDIAESDAPLPEVGLEGSLNNTELGGPLVITELNGPLDIPESDGPLLIAESDGLVDNPVGLDGPLDIGESDGPLAELGLDVNVLRSKRKQASKPVQAFTKDDCKPVLELHGSLKISVASVRYFIDKEPAKMEKYIQMSKVKGDRNTLGYYRRHQKGGEVKEAEPWVPTQCITFENGQIIVKDYDAEVYLCKFLQNIEYEIDKHDIDFFMVLDEKFAEMFKCFLYNRQIRKESLHHTAVVRALQTLNEPLYIPKQLRTVLMVKWPGGPATIGSISDAVKSDPEFQAAWNALVCLSDNSEERAKNRFYESLRGYKRN